MATYWHKHPRNFANECSIYRADTNDQAAELADAGYERLTYAAARKHVAWVNAENDAWESNRAFGVTRWDDVVHGDEYSARHFATDTNR